MKKVSTYAILTFFVQNQIEFNLVIVGADNWYWGVEVNCVGVTAE